MVITKKHLDNGYNYKDYTDLVTKLYNEDKTTSGDNTQDMLDYTKLNIQRSSRWDKRGVLLDEVKEAIKKIDRKVTWVVLTEGWCGDASQSVPFINKMAEENPNIDLKLLLRDQNLDVMDEYLTNGKSRSIPKMIAIDSDTFEELGVWGPRPDSIQKKFEEMMADPNNKKEDVIKDIHLWYAKDKGESIQKEFLKLVENW